MPSLQELFEIDNNEQRINEVKKHRKKIIPFVGAGISQSCGLLSWRGLLDKLANGYLEESVRKSFENTDNLIKYAQRISRAAGNDSMFAYNVKELCAYKKENVSDLPEMIMNGFSNQVITTNYDTILEDTKRRKVILPSATIQMTEAIALKKPCLIKIHGSISEPSSIILTRDQYTKLYSINKDKKSVLYEQLCSIYQGSMLLFLGCSLQKDYTLEALRNSVERNSGIKHYAFVPSPDAPNEKVAFNVQLSKLGVIPIYYPKGEYEYIKIFLEYVTSTDKKAPAIKNISKTAKNKASSELFLASQNKYLDQMILGLNNNYDKEECIKNIIQTLFVKKGEQGEKVKCSFDEVKEYIYNSSERYVLSIKGLQGTGKSTFFSYLYYELNKEKNIRNICPIIIDLQYWGKLQGDDAESLFKDELQMITDEINRKEYEKYIILVDGTDESYKKTSNLERIIFDYLEKLEGNQYAICLSLANSIPKNLKKNVAGLYKSPQKAEYAIEFHRLSKFDSNLGSLINAICEFYNIKERKDISAIEEIAREGISGKIDFRTILMIVKTYQQRLNSANKFTLGKSFYAYYSDKLKTKEELINASRCIYEYEVCQNRGKIEKYEYSEIAYKNSITRDFFLAIYFISAFLENGDREELINKEILFTAQVNWFIKDLIGEIFQENAKIIAENLMNSWEDASVFMKSQIAYILGRIKPGRNYNSKIQEFIFEKFDFQRKKLFNDGKILQYNKSFANNIEAELFLFRTLSVSAMCYKESNDRKEFFLASILENEQLNAINRGFHLAYYGDKPYINGSIPEFSDSPDDVIKKTMTHLYSNIKRYLNEDNSQYRIVSLDIITLFSLYQYRVNTNVIKEEIPELKDVVDQLLGKPEIKKNRLIYEYLYMLQYHFEHHKTNSYADIIRELYEVKNVKRTGWVRRQVELPESIADHMYSSYLLALMFLPDSILSCSEYKLDDRGKYEDYSKQRIIEMILFHDLAECITGDIPSHEKTTEQREYENRIAKSISDYSSFPKIYGLWEKKDIWDDFSNQKSINAKLAHEIDKIDSLVQALLYKERNDKNKISIDEWKEYVTKEVKTSLGIEILKLVLNSFAITNGE